MLSVLFVLLAATPSSNAGDSRCTEIHSALRMSYELDGHADEYRQWEKEQKLRRHLNARFDEAMELIYQNSKKMSLAEAIEATRKSFEGITCDFANGHVEKIDNGNHSCHRPTKNLLISSRANAIESRRINWKPEAEYGKKYGGIEVCVEGRLSADSELFSACGRYATAFVVGGYLHPLSASEPASPEKRPVNENEYLMANLPESCAAQSLDKQIAEDIAKVKQAYSEESETPLKPRVATDKKSAN